MGERVVESCVFDALSLVLNSRGTTSIRGIAKTLLFLAKASEEGNYTLPGEPGV